MPAPRHIRPPGRVFIGTAGWSIPAAHRAAFDRRGSVLETYATRLNAAEINSSFYRPHRRSTYERWSAAVPADFRFAVKAPKTVTHLKRLKDCSDELARFADEVGGLGTRLGAVLVQLPPGLAFDHAVATDFFRRARPQFGAPIACEPRHPSWFGPAADEMLRALGIARVGADPPPAAGAAETGGDIATAYLRLHGAPRIYYSDYDAGYLRALARDVTARAAASAAVWCIFDNTAAGHATANALALAELRTA